MGYSQRGTSSWKDSERGGTWGTLERATWLGTQEQGKREGQGRRDDRTLHVLRGFWLSFGSKEVEKHVDHILMNPPWVLQMMWQTGQAGSSDRHEGTRVR